MVAEVQTETLGATLGYVVLEAPVQTLADKSEVNSEIVDETLKKCMLRHKSISRLTRFDH